MYLTRSGSESIDRFRLRNLIHCCFPLSKLFVIQDTAYLSWLLCFPVDSHGHNKHEISVVVYIKWLTKQKHIKRQWKFLRCTEPSYSNESYDSVSRKPLDGFQNALHNKHIFIFGEGLITNMSLDITIYSTLLINLSFFMHCFFHNTNYHSSESCS